MSLILAFRRLMQADLTSRPIWSARQVQELHSEILSQAKQKTGEVQLVANGSSERHRRWFHNSQHPNHNTRMRSDFLSKNLKSLIFFFSKTFLCVCICAYVCVEHMAARG